MSHRISLTLNGNVDAVERVVRRMLDNAGFTEVAFTMTRVGRGSEPKRGTAAKNRTIRVPDEIWVKFQRAAAKEGKSVTDWLIEAGQGACGNYMGDVELEAWRDERRPQSLAPLSDTELDHLRRLDGPPPLDHLTISRAVHPMVIRAVREIRVLRERVSELEARRRRKP